MGTEIDQEEFGDRDYRRFAERLEECLAALGQLLDRPGFGAGPATIGADCLPRSASQQLSLVHVHGSGVWGS